MRSVVIFAVFKPIYEPIPYIASVKFAFVRILVPVGRKNDTPAIFRKVS
jgi:hypothetical protein